MDPPVRGPCAARENDLASTGTRHEEGPHDAGTEKGSALMTGRSGDELSEQSPADHANGMIDEAEEESFPASDAPTSWSGQDPRDQDVDEAEERS